MVFVACANAPSMGLLRIALSAFAAVLLFIGIKSLRSLLLIAIAIIPVQSSVLGFGPAFGFQLTFNRVLVLILIVCFLLHRSEYPRAPGRREPLLYFLIGILVLSILSDALGDGAFLSGEQQTISESVEVFLFAYICYRVFRTAELECIVSVFAIGGIALCASTVLERITGLNLLFRFPIVADISTEIDAAALTLDRADVLRVRGSFQNPVYLSGFLPLVLFAAVYLLVKQRRRLLGSVLLALVLLTAYFSISRTAVYALAILGVPVLLMNQKRVGFGKIVKATALSAVLAGMLLLIFPDDMQRAFSLIFNPFDASLGGSDTSDRMNLITAGIPFVLNLNPFGAGVDQGHLVSVLLAPDIANFFIDYAISRGVIWVAGFCIFLAYMMKRLIDAGDPEARMLFWLAVSLTATYVSYAQYSISFRMLLVFVLVHLGHRQPAEEQDARLKVVDVGFAV